VRAALRRASLERYPDRECHELRAALARRAGLAAEWLLCGNGAAELIHLVARAVVRPGDPVLVATPTFGEYAHASALNGGRVVEETWALPLGGGLDWRRLRAAILAGRPRLVWLCAPNNPTGDALDSPAAAELLAATATAGGVLVVDEAYADLLLDGEPPDLTPLLAGPHGARLLLLRSLTKGYALAGLRLGYLLARPEALAAPRRLRPPWTVNALAQAAGLAALAADDDLLARDRARLTATKRWLVAALGRAGYPVAPGRTNWLLVEVGDAAGVRRKLLTRGLLVRDCASFGLPAHIRVAVRRPGECRRLVAVLAALRAEGSA
jgi:threonine-phosphate decarboxylase